MPFENAFTRRSTVDKLMLRLDMYHTEDQSIHSSSKVVQVIPISI